MKRNIMVAIVLMALLPTLLIGCAVNYYTVATVKSEKLEAIASMAHMMSAHLSGYYERLVSDMQSKAQNDEFIKILIREKGSEIPSDVRIETQRILMAPTAFPVMRGSVIDISGKVVLSTEPDDEGLELNKTELYSTIIGGKESYNGLISNYMNKNSAEIAVPIYNSQNQVIGILKQDVNLDLLGDYLNSLNPVSACYAFVVRKNGDMIFDKAREGHTILYQEYQNENSLEQLVTDFKEGNSLKSKGFVEFEEDGATYFGAYEVIPSINCIAVVALNQEEMLGALAKVRAIFTGVILLVLICIALIGYFVYRKHVSPLNKMNSTLRSIANGDLAARCKINGYIELEDLCKNINGLADSYQKSERELRMSYRIDNLTRLPNREAIYEVLDTLLYKHPNQALLLLDLDGFKTVNDNLGNDIGDRILIEIGDILRKLPQHVCYPSRLGGAEFLVFITNWTAPEYPERIAEKIIREIEEIRFIDEVHVDIDASVGIVYTEEERIEKKKLIKYANIAMHKAKMSGKNSHFVHYPYMQK